MKLQTNYSTKECAMAKKKISTPHYEISLNPVVRDESTIYLCNSEGIDSPEHYIGLIDYLSKKTEDDFLNLVLVGPGGSLTTTIALISAVTASKAVVQADIIGDVSSGHAMLALACDTFKLYPGTSVMLHTFTGGTYGKGRDSIESIKYTELQLREILEANVLGFMTQEEIDNMLEQNRDKFFIGEDLQNRITNLLITRKNQGKLKPGVVVEVPEEE